MNMEKGNYAFPKKSCGTCLELSLGRKKPILSQPLVHYKIYLNLQPCRLLYTILYSVLWIRIMGCLNFVRPLGSG